MNLCHKNIMMLIHFVYCFRCILKCMQTIKGTYMKVHKVHRVKFIFQRLKILISLFFYFYLTFLMNIIINPYW